MVAPQSDTLPADATRDMALLVSFEAEGVTIEAVTCRVDPVGALISTDVDVAAHETLSLLVRPQGAMTPPIRLVAESLPSPRQGILAVRWITASSSPDPKPLRDFLQKTLVISGGFVEVTDRGGGRREFVYHFPQVSEPPPLPPIEPPAPVPEAAVREPRPEPSSTIVARRIKMHLPALYTFDGTDCAGEVVRLSVESVSVVSDGRNVPELGTRVGVVIGIRDRRDRTHDVTLAGPVVRILASSPPSRFDLVIEDIQEAKEGIFRAYVQYLFRQAGLLPTGE